MDDLISRQAVLEGLASIAKAKAKSDAQKSLMGRTMFFVERLPSVNPQENNEDIHREREQAYMKGYEDASKRYRTEPCDDAISRAMVKKIIKTYVEELDASDLDSKQYAIRGAKTVGMLILDLPPVSVAEKVERWIPVSEKLPEDGIYLVTVERTTGKPRIETKSYAKDLNRVDDFDFPEHKCGWYEYDSEYGYWEDTDVIAWQSLPQPYKAVGEVGESE